jgi:H+/Cl- antiporter ClcA
METMRKSARPAAEAGLSFAQIVGWSLPASELDAGKCAVAGMAALLAATVRAPIAGLMLVIEMTRNYQLLIMALLASIIADATAEFLGGRPVYEQLLDRSRAVSDNTFIGLSAGDGRQTHKCERNATAGQQS